MRRSGLLYNLIWKFLERISAQLISLCVSIILARLLEPSHYGVISIVMIFITIADVFVNEGFGSALIQKKDIQPIDYYSVLYFNIGFSFILYTILFFSAPLIAGFYGEEFGILVPVLRILGLRILVTAINTVQYAYISRHMMFKKLFVSTLGGTICSAIVGIVMACAGFGVWSLVAQYLISSVVCTLTLTVVLKKPLRLVFSIKSLSSLFPYGIRILGTGLLITGYQELRALIIGKVYSSADLAYYDKGRQFPNLIVTNINTSIGSVLFPKMSSEQDDRERIKATTRHSIRFSAYLMCPMMLGLSAVAEPFIKLILTEKWLVCVPLLQMFCVIYLFQPIHTANMQAIKAIGRSDVYLKLEIVKKIIELVVLLVAMWISVEAIVIGMALCTTLFTFVNAYPNIKLINYSFKEQIMDILPSLVMALIMFICVSMLQAIPLNEWIIFLAQILTGISVYLLLSIVTKNKEFLYIKKLCCGIINRRAVEGE